MKHRRIYIYPLIFCMILGLGFYIKNIALRNKLQKIGLKAELYEQYESNGGNGFYNYYFKSCNNKIIAVTHHVNSKGSSKGGKFEGKSVLYLKDNENKYVIIPYEERSYLSKYFILYPFLIYILLLFPINFVLGIIGWIKKINHR